MEDAAGSPINLRPLWGALILALILRVGVWVQVHEIPLYSQPSGDAATYVALADLIASEGPLAPRGAVYNQAPLYPMFLSALQGMGLSLGGIRWVQHALGILGVFLMWLIGRSIGGRYTAALSAFLAAAYGPLIFFESELLSICLAIFLLQLALVAWLRNWKPILAGLFWGLAVLAQPNLLLAGLLVVAVGFYNPKWLGRAKRSALVFTLIGLMIPCSLTLARNLSEAGSPTLVSANGGINFFIGNNRQANGTFHLPPDSGLINRPEGLFASAAEVAEKAQGLAPTPANVDRFWWNRGFDFWIGQPGTALGLGARKVMFALNNYEVPNHFDFGYFRERSRVLWALPTLGWIIPFALVGFVLLWRRGRALLPLVGIGIVISVTLFFVTARYRLPLVVVALPACAFALNWLWDQRRSLTKAWPAGILIAAALVIAFIPMIQTDVTQAHMMNLEGAALAQQGDVKKAEEAFLRAAEQNPQNAEALNNLGRMQAEQGKITEALQNYREALRANPLQAETYFNLEELYREGERYEEALQILDKLEEARGGQVADVAPALAYRRGLGQLAMGDTAKAAELLGEAVRANANLGGAWSALAKILLANQDGRACEAAQRAMSLVRTDLESHHIYGVCLEAQGKHQEALGVYEKAWKISPSNPETPFRLGRVHYQLGDMAKAEGHFRAAIERGKHPGALMALGSVYERLQRPQDARTVYTILSRDLPTSPEAKLALDRLRVLGRSTSERP
ncbi:MAG: tetratricopeptide repeat protein [Candidatus Eisenbacteria bacterium]|uniref:Tetratricopeptide repeat protein n=1 Tax=Eiseniibacteriota bacterium TaxID=2212470 RepID=A0A7Y2H0R8_UNCEI|nr:tetratricopeptide repeat protein [Candidatus Eisenbacteria bacterium]